MCHNTGKGKPILMEKNKSFVNGGWHLCPLKPEAMDAMASLFTPIYNKQDAAFHGMTLLVFIFSAFVQGWCPHQPIVYFLFIQNLHPELSNCVSSLTEGTLRLLTELV